LFTLQHDLLRLRHEREKLKLEMRRCSRSEAGQWPDSRRPAHSRTDMLTRQMEGSLEADWHRMFYVGGGCSALSEQAESEPRRASASAQASRTF